MSNLSSAVQHATAVIPAANEGGTVGAVVEAATASVLVGEVIVVDGYSTDDTAAQAEARGARVVLPPRPGKGEAMAAGVTAADAETVVFLDGDLLGLRPYHVDRLVRTVTAGGAAMACGLFDRGPLLNQLFLHVFPILTGERAVRRELFESLGAGEITGYRVEAALNACAGELVARRRSSFGDGPRLHPASLRCSSLTYAWYARSSRTSDAGADRTPTLTRPRRRTTRPAGRGVRL